MIIDGLRCVCLSFFFFFKQKTAYELRISDWSSDVCSSDLRAVVVVGLAKCRDAFGRADAGGHRERTNIIMQPAGRRRDEVGEAAEIGRASCRERVCQYV